MALGFKDIVSSLERRYDYLSARAVVMEALANTGLGKKATYDDKEADAVLGQIAGIAGDLDRVWTALGRAPKGVAMPAASDGPGESEAAKPADSDVATDDAPPPQAKKATKKAPKKASKKKS